MHRLELPVQHQHAITYINNIKRKMTTAGSYLNNQVGPGGGNGGVSWKFDLGDSRLTGIKIWKDGATIWSIMFTYVDGVTEETCVSGRFGKMSDDSVMAIFDADEKLIQIGGTWDYKYADNVQIITSLSFETNKRRLGRYGSAGASSTPFSLPVNEGKVVGFFGKSGDRLDNLGLIVKSPIVKVGPEGGNGGDSWKFDLGDSRLTGIKIWKDGATIWSIMFTYVDGVTEETGVSGQYGKMSDDSVMATFDADEELIQIGGTWDYKYADNVQIITSLSFETNKRILGPYGSAGASSTPFSLPVNEGKVVSFFGKSGDRLDNLGLIVMPLRKAGDV